MMQGEINWNELKNERLKKVRGVSFQELLNSQFVGLRDHHSRDNQKILLFWFKNYIWVVPFVLDDKGIFLKTLFPDRKLTKLYKNREVERHEED